MWNLRRSLAHAAVVMLLVGGIVWLARADDAHPPGVRDPPHGPSLTAELRLVYPLAYYNAFQHRGLNDAVVGVADLPTNVSRLRLSATYLGLTPPIVHEQSVSAGQHGRAFEVQIPLDRGTMTNVSASTRWTLQYQVEGFQQETKVFVRTASTTVEVLPLDLAVLWTKKSDGTLSWMTDYLAAFVAPTDPAIQELLSVARTFHPERRLEGPQCGPCASDEWTAYTRLQVKAIFDALQQHYRMGYASMEASFNGLDTDLQRVNRPGKAMELGFGNCLDGSIIVSSSLEALGFRSYIVLRPGHAYVAWDASPTGSARDALETTMLGDASFEKANRRGLEQFELDEPMAETGSDPLYRLLDVRALHEQGFLPNP